MIARVVAAEAKPGKIEEVAGFFPGQRLAEIRQASGNVGFFMLAEPGSNKVMMGSLWEDAEALGASAPIFQAHAAVFGQLLVGPPSPTTYEVRVAAAKLPDVVA